MSNLVTESLQRPGCFLVGEANKTRSRTKGTLAEDQNLQAGTVVAKVSTTTSAAATAKVGNAGNGVMGTVTASDPVKEGRYTVRITAASTNAGSFVVRDPDGDQVGNGTVAVAYDDGSLAFTLADGGNDFGVGDEIYIDVDRSEGVYSQLAPAGTDGSETAAGILFAGVDATDVTGGLPCVVVDDDAVVRPSKLVWPVGISAAAKSAAVTRLRELGIKMAQEY